VYYTAKQPGMSIRSRSFTPTLTHTHTHTHTHKQTHMRARRNAAVQSNSRGLYRQFSLHNNRCLPSTKIQLVKQQSDEDCCLVVSCCHSSNHLMSVYFM